MDEQQDTSLSTINPSGSSPESSKNTPETTALNNFDNKLGHLTELLVKILEQKAGPSRALIVLGGWKGLKYLIFYPLAHFT